MTMAEVEQSILDDLALLGDGLNRMEYLLGCARADPGIPEEERAPDALVAGCQTNTWFLASWEGDVLKLRTDSESILVKGALSLITEIYSGRNRREIGSFSCSLLAHDSFAALFNGEQKKGLRNVLNALREGGDPN